MQDTSKKIIHNSVFEITDYTTASNWERFIALIEEILTQWGLSNKIDRKMRNLVKLDEGDICNGTWHEKHEILRYGDSAFDVKFFYLEDQDKILQSSNDTNTCVTAKDTDQSISEGIDTDPNNVADSETLPDCLVDIMSTENDFASKAHCLVRWYSLRHLIVLSPRGDTIISENRVKLILSSASIALTNTSCQIPFFVNIHNPKNNFYQGISEHPSIRSLYQMVFLNRNFQSFTCLSDLISLFRDKVTCSLNTSISISARLTYCVRRFDSFGIHMTEEQFHSFQEQLSKEYPDKENDREVEHESTKTFFGPNSTIEEVIAGMKTCPPAPRRALQSFQLGVRWLPRSDKVIIDNQVHTDLEPSEAPIWTLRCLSRQLGHMTVIYQTIELVYIFRQAIDYSYKYLDGDKQFANTTKEKLYKETFELSFKISKEHEIEISRCPSDDIRRIVAVIIHLSKIDYSIDESNLKDPMLSHDERFSDWKSNTTLNDILYNFKDRHSPSIKEFILRTQVSRPFKSDTLLPQRMFCTISEDELRLCGAFTESCS